MTAAQQTPASVSLPLQPTSHLLTGSVLLEVIAPPSLPALRLPGWTLLAWPQARLGDLTLEAVPHGPQGLDELLGGLRALGFTPLGYRLHR